MIANHITELRHEVKHIERAIEVLGLPVWLLRDLRALSEVGPLDTSDLTHALAHIRTATFELGRARRTVNEIIRRNQEDKS